MAFFIWLELCGKSIINILLNIFSQSPNFKNRIYLTNNLDNFGLRKIDIEWDLQNDDLKNYIDLIKKSSKNKKILINKDVFLKKFYKNGLAGQHPSCTTKLEKVIKMEWLIKI